MEYQKNVKNRRGRRIAMATALAPWAIVPIVALWILVGRFDVATDVMNGDVYFFESFVTYLSFVALWSLIGVGVAYAATIIYGIPVYLILTRYKHGSLRSIVLAGTLGSGLLAILMGTDLLAGLVFIGCGLAVSAVFWIVVNR
tara:strand:- start:4472 stop:4900 length:429 start_codon:yes stop_codon:yes gene_type:complete